MFWSKLLRFFSEQIDFLGNTEGKIYFFFHYSNTP